MSGPQSGPNSGGDLSDMAVKGTSIPEDSAKPNYIPSVPRPNQTTIPSNSTTTTTPLPQVAADNATDIPRGPSDKSTTDSILSGTGNSVPSSVETKRLHEGANNPLAKGHDRYDKHARGPSEFDAGVGAEPGMAGVMPAPGEEEKGLDNGRDVKTVAGVDEPVGGRKETKAGVQESAAANNLI